MSVMSSGLQPDRASPARELFGRLIDDAAVFPPGLAPLPLAVASHHLHRKAWYASMVGPLLVPTADAARLAELVPADGDPLSVVLIARPGDPLTTVTDALRLLGNQRHIRVTGVEAGWAPGWREHDLGDGDLVLEVPRDNQMMQALAEIAADGPASAHIRAKFRTGATASWAWPDERELAQFIMASIGHDLGFKLTGGLHHIVRATHSINGEFEEQHGLLNVLSAVGSALGGGSLDAITAVLAERDPTALVPTLMGMDAAAATRLRKSFTGYGCCGVTDPVDELLALKLIGVGA